jgi:hypothetical protein
MAKDKKRIVSYLDDRIYQMLKSKAASEQRQISQMVAWLLTQALDSKPTRKN